MQKEPQRCHELWKNFAYLRQLFKKKLSYLQLLFSESPIFCFQLANPGNTLRVEKQLISAEIFAPAIRPPTVPRSRVRITIMANNHRKHIEKLVNVLGNL